jgi:uncharacterized protein YdeI (YjbR/CyaY-like superfamily)
MADKTNALFFRDRAAWRGWLRANHKRRTEAWVAHLKKGSLRKGLKYEEGVEEALCYGWIDGLTHAHDEDYFLQRYSPRKPRSLWSESNKRRVERLIRQRKMTRAGMVHVESAQADGRWQAAELRRDPDWIPEALLAALRQTPGALEAYRSLPRSQREMYGYSVETAKKPETVEKRIRAAVDAALHRRQAKSMPRGRASRPG